MDLHKFVEALRFQLLFGLVILILMDLGAESAVSRVKSYSLLTLRSKANPRAHPYQDSY